MTVAADIGPVKLYYFDFGDFAKGIHFLRIDKTFQIIIRRWKKIMKK